MMKVSMSSSSLMGSHSNNGFKFSEDYGEEVIVQKPAAESEQRGFLASWLFKKRFSTASQHTESTYHMNSDSSFDERSSTSSEDNVGLFLEEHIGYGQGPEDEWLASPHPHRRSAVINVDEIPKTILTEELRKEILSSSPRKSSRRLTLSEELPTPAAQKRARDQRLLVSATAVAAAVAYIVVRPRGVRA